MTGEAPARILITGGAGFLGSRLVQRYLDGGSIVRVVRRPQHASSNGEQTPPAALELVELDLGDLGSNLEVFAGQDLVIHTAAMLHARTAAERELQERINVGATRSVLEACRHNKVPRLIHVSTTAAIGISADPKHPADEDLRFNLDQFDLSYNRTKLQAERLVLDSHDAALEAIVVNPGFIFGRHPAGYRGKEVIDRVLHRRFVLCTNGGLSVVHIDDVVDGIRSAAERARAGQRYILSGQNLSFHDIARTVSRIAEQDKTVITVPDVARDLLGLYSNSRFARRRGDAPQLNLDRRYAYQYYSSEKARRELGYRPRPFENIVADALEYIRGPA